ncbi:hypothetical protein BerOc1_02319 [Pseudodesulfovibrio hydrargyri]|uniref:Uncharacterized protein n=1 Tax=Pseudodesulfovibrio hydrargyri TaxID=2125990 RepID=A0A1J5MX47_9BACT|nr:hypothetical protein [Pseudodesulfovibrio hydrargyri]OIQ50388.1 hypothetical protein BerOc1_02319 [Pseudodesulfovibrio hydrargyri]
MYKRLIVLLFACFLFLPSCQHNLGDTSAPKADGPVDLRYGPGSFDLRSTVNVTVGMKGMDGTEIPVMVFDSHYVIKKVGSRLAWNVVLDNQNSGGSLNPEPFYSVSFTTDVKGRNMADKVVHEVPGKDELGLGETILDGLELPLEKVAVGDPSIALPVKAFQSKDTQILFPEPSPKYVFDGVKEVGGKECYAFSYESELTVRQYGKEYPGSMHVSTTCTKEMLPVSADSELTMNGPMKDMVTVIVGKVRELTAQDMATSTAAQEAKAMHDLRTALDKAPLQLVTEPMTFHYVPASVRLKAEATLTPAEKGEPAVKLPFMEFVMKIDTAAQSPRLAWNVAMSDFKVLGQPLEMPEAIGFAFTTDASGRDIQGFQDNTGTGVLSVADIESDFIIPEGAYRSGDVCMPVKIKGKAANLQYDFPEGEGFVFQGVKTVDSMKVGVFTADIAHFTANAKGAEVVHHGSLSMVRYYDLATMMPLWYDGKVVMEMVKGSVTTTGSLTRIMD